MDRFVRGRDYNLGPLRNDDVRHRVAYIVEHWQQITGRKLPASAEWPDIADEAIAASFADEAAAGVQWNLRLGVLIALRLLEKVNAHDVAAKLREIAQAGGLL